MKSQFQTIISFSFLIFFIGFTNFCFSQKRAVTVIDTEKFNSESVFSQIGEIPLKKSNQFLAVSTVLKAENWNSGSDFLQIRFSKDNQNWSNWEDLKEDPHSKKEEGRFISRLIFTEKDAQFFEIKKETSKPISDLKIHFYNPGKSKTFRPQNSNQNRAGCDECDLPPALERKDWCPNGNCPKGTDPVATDVTHLIVHHTATPNDAGDWDAVVRSIWDFHVNVNGWDDIGYNYLISPEGRVYVGRGNDIRGAHFCGNNTGTMGTGMIGNFTDEAPKQDALKALKSLLSWKNCDKGLDPVGTAFHASSGLNLNHISGHLDGCSTACPGDTFYPMFDDLRADVQGHIEDDCPDLVSNIQNPFLNENTVMFFPNPTGGNLNIAIDNNLSGELKISVFDNQSKEMIRDFEFSKVSENQSFTMDLNEFNNGIYFLEINQNGEKAVFKIIKN